MGNDAIDKKSNSNGMKAVALVAAIVAIIGLMFAFTEPMGQRLSFMEDQLIDLRAKRQLDNDKNELRHNNSSEDRGATHEKFKEVETQFIGMQDLISIQFVEISRRMAAGDKEMTKVATYQDNVLQRLAVVETLLERGMGRGTGK